MEGDVWLFLFSLLVSGLLGNGCYAVFINVKFLFPHSSGVIPVPLSLVGRREFAVFHYFVKFAQGASWGWTQDSQGNIRP